MLTGAGGRLGVVHARALKKADPSLHLIGIDADPFRIYRAATDEIHLVPRSSSPDFITVLRETVRRTRADLLLTNVTADIAVISAARDDIGCKTFLPEHTTIQTCDDKARSNAAWQEAAVPVPRSMSVATRADLERAFKELGPELWLRSVSGSGATGALPVSDMETGIRWIDLNRGWGRFMAAERLGAETTSWESVWQDGRLVVAQARKRLFWEFGRIAMSGISGIAGAGEAVADPEVDRIGMSAVKAVSQRPHGVLGVDLAYDRNSKPKVTEINAGRFMSGGVCHFAAADFNIPIAAVRAALGEDPGFEPPLLNPVTPGLIFVSGLDREPVFTTHAEVKKLQAGMAARMKSAKRGASS
jgi:carbamoyl-phosphate synthase large subunit